MTQQGIEGDCPLECVQIIADTERDRCLNALDRCLPSRVQTAANQRYMKRPI